MRLLAFHLGATNAPGEAEADITAGEGALASGRVVRIDALAASADRVEEVIDVEEQRQTTLEQVCAHTAVNGEVRVNLGQQGLCATAIDSVGEHLQAVEPFAAIMLPKLCPEVQPQRVAEHIALGPLVGTVLNTVVVIDEVGIEVDVALLEIRGYRLPDYHFGMHLLHGTPSGITDALAVRLGRDEQQFQLAVVAFNAKHQAPHLLP